MSGSEYYYNKLERIQFALDFLRRALNGDDIARMINRLEQLETTTARDLIEAEQAEQ